MFPGIAQSLPGRPHCPLFEIGDRKSKIANVAVPVVQRIEYPLGIYFVAGACAA